jgi:ATP-binding cassette, subfamily B (MDR/TAP), member 1
MSIDIRTCRQSILFANSIDALSLLPPAYGLLRQRIDFWSSMYLMLGLVAFITWTGQGISFSLSSERLTLRARDLSFRSILRQQIAFFDQKAHSTGALTALLSTKSTQLAGLSGAVLGIILTAFATLAGGIILSLVIGWKLALVCTATIPIILGCGWARLRMLTLFEVKVRKAHEDSATYATEAVIAIRTIASLSLEDHVLKHYSSILATTSSKSLKSILKASTFYAASQSCVFLVAALGFWYGGGLISTHEYSMLQFFICFAALISGSQSVGAVFSFAPDMSKATNAARELKTLFDRTPSIDTVAPSGVRIRKCDGMLEMKDVTFRYPSRLENVVLDRFTMNVSPGRFVALVGASGCGKSTVISLLERFFDPVAGKVFVDGQDIATLNVNDYRRLVALVGQEPAIYQGSIRENIVLGSDENVSEDAIIQACREANIYDFIMSLPAGFSTIVGSRGSLLSGGQKQRLAIARALLRDTKILLLDEATSALDADSEKVVQEALDAARKGRTTICVAHRLGTVRGADEILVLEKGRVVERGSHEELMQRGGVYTNLVNLQSLESSGN